VFISVTQIGTWEKIKYAKNMPQPDGKTNQMVVVARQWEWRVRYPGPVEVRNWEKDAKGAEAWSKLADYPYEDYPQSDDVHVVNEVHAWKDGRVLVHLKTRDVLHSFFLPQLRLKQDAVPGKVIRVWFEATDYNVEYDAKADRWVDRKDDQGNTKPFVWDLA